MTEVLILVYKMSISSSRLALEIKDNVVRNSIAFKYGGKIWIEMDDKGK
jgi:hypothetical protein